MQTIHSDLKKMSKFGAERDEIQIDDVIVSESCKLLAIPFVRVEAHSMNRFDIVEFVM